MEAEFLKHKEDYHVQNMVWRDVEELSEKIVVTHQHLILRSFKFVIIIIQLIFLTILNLMVL